MSELSKKRQFLITIASDEDLQEKDRDQEEIIDSISLFIAKRFGLDCINFSVEEIEE